MKFVNSSRKGKIRSIVKEVMSFYIKLTR